MVKGKEIFRCYNNAKVDTYMHTYIRAKIYIYIYAYLSIYVYIYIYSNGLSVVYSCSIHVEISKPRRAHSLVCSMGFFQIKATCL